jgi:hypothetical protein
LSETFLRKDREIQIVNKLPCLMLLLVFLLTGCDWLERVYTYRQEEEPVGTIIVRVNIGPDGRLVMLEQFETDGKKKSTIIRDDFSKCEYIDMNNWTCESAQGNERVVMSSGTLTHFYGAQQK